MAYSNPLHTPVSKAQLSSYSTIGVALGYTSGKAEFVVAHRRRLPQGCYAPGGWRLQNGATVQLKSGIKFDYSGYRNQGVIMNDCKNRDKAISMDGANDIVLQAGRITLRILWPGYSADYARSIDINGSITRAQLAQKVAAIFANYTETHTSLPCGIPDYRIATNQIQFAHLVLVSLHNVFEDVWQADVAIDLR